MLKPLSFSLHIPVELLREIIKWLDTVDQRNITLVSRILREEALPFAFKELSYTGLEIPRKIRGIHQAREDIKAVIRKVRIQVMIISPGDIEARPIIFDFLRTLPFLQVFEFKQTGVLIDSSALPQLLDSVRHAPLSELLIDTGTFFKTQGGHHAEGLVSLQKLSIPWCLGDEDGAPGSSITYLRHITHPSLKTLVELNLEYCPQTPATSFDLSLLKEAGETLRVFRFTTRNIAEDVLDIIPDIFPHLTTFAFKWPIVNGGPSILWKDSHILSLSKNVNLENLQLSSDFEYEANDRCRADRDFFWFIRCYKRRLNATIKISKAMPKLRDCTWIQLRVGSLWDSSMEHPFVIENGPKSTRVVRGVKQWWMGSIRECWETGEKIVDCRLEALPGNIIGENDPYIQGESDSESESEDESEEDEDEDDEGEDEDGAEDNMRYCYSDEDIDIMEDYLAN